MTKAVFQTVDELRGQIKGSCFDTTAANTGVTERVCIKLETEFGRELLPTGINFHYPGELNCACWMERAINCLTMSLFQDE